MNIKDKVTNATEKMLNLTLVPISIFVFLESLNGDSRFSLYTSQAPDDQLELSLLFRSSSTLADIDFAMSRTDLIGKALAGLLFRFVAIPWGDAFLACCHK